MTREEKIARAVELRGQGVLRQEIATYLGVGLTTVTRWTNQRSMESNRRASQRWKDEHREANRARDRQRAQDIKVPCPHCGTPHEPDGEMCQSCHGAVADVRRTLTEGMWADGWKKGEINAALGLPARSPFIYVMRAQRGYDLPHRRTPEQLARIRAGNPRLKA